MQTFRMCVSQSNGLFLAHVANIDSIVLLNLSTSPSLCGWYGVVRVLCTCRILHSLCSSCDSNCHPWSEWSCSGAEKHIKTSSTSLSAMVLASWLGIRIASIVRSSCQQPWCNNFPYHSKAVGQPNQPPLSEWGKWLWLYLMELLISEKVISWLHR